MREDQSDEAPPVETTPAVELLEMLGKLPGVLQMPLGEFLHRLTDGPRRPALVSGGAREPRSPEVLRTMAREALAKSRMRRRVGG